MVFGLFKKQSKPKIYQFDSHPNGKYVVKYIEETYSHDEFILVVLEITRGEYSGDKIPVMFQDQKAKKITREYTGMFVDRLVYEGVVKAEKLEEARMYSESDSNNEFIVNMKDSLVSSIPEYDFEAVEKMILKLKHQ